MKCKNCGHVIETTPFERNYYHIKDGVLSTKCWKSYPPNTNRICICINPEPEKESEKKVSGCKRE